jgi:hypothetical protein
LAGLGDVMSGAEWFLVMTNMKNLEKRLLK